jgi:hypothetical protein
MHLNQLYAALALAISWSCFAAPTTPFTAWGKSGDEMDARFCGNLGALKATAGANGKLQTGALRKASARQQSIPLQKYEMINSIWAMLLDSGSVRQKDPDVLVAYESENAAVDGSSGGLCRFSGDLKKRRWCTQFPAFNMVVSMSADKTVFLAGIGTAAEIDPRSGKYLWKVSDLYDRSKAFNVFLTPVETGSTVEFYATDGIDATAPWKALIDRRTGQLKSAVQVQTSSTEAVKFSRVAGSCAE